MANHVQPAHLHLDNVTKKFERVTAVDHISLDIPRGTFTTLLGPSGCGKTTLLRLIAGFYEPDEGGIYIDDQRVDQMPPHRRGTAMVFQDYALWPHMTVFDNIAYGLRMQNASKEDINRRVQETMGLVEMPSELLNRRPSQLSGGQQQRVAVARALVTQPKVLLLDEPLSNLDAKVRQRLRVEIRRLQRRIGITSVYVTHDQEEALSMSDMVVVMNAGRVMQIGQPEEIYHNPQTAFVAEFLGVSNVLRGTVTPDGKGAMVAGVCVPYSGALPKDPRPGREVQRPAEPSGAGTAVTAVFKADEAYLVPGTSTKDDAVVFHGKLEEVFFIGSLYRHYVNVNGEMILVDGAQKITGPDVSVIVPKGKIMLYT